MATKYVVTGEQDRSFHNKLFDIERQWRAGALNPAFTLPGLQLVDENKEVMERPVEAKKKILKFLGTVTIPATKEKFIAREKFVVDNSDQAKVKIAWIEGDFEKHFLNIVEKPQAESKLCRHRILRASADGPIIGELGTPGQVMTSLSALFFLLEQQGHGQPKEDGLAVNGSANIFYIYDLAVSVHWYGSGWELYAESTSNPRGWLVGLQVFSRSSLLAA